MKKNIIFLMLIGLFFSCSSDDQEKIESPVVGSWKLIEVLADPGDGSGTFRAVESNKTIEFKSNGTIATNTSLCDPYSDEIKSSGSYSVTTNKITTNCQNPNIATISFELKDNYLILHFISNEGYSQKFQRIN
ncbi:lipocalin-like domain-containing protein [Flavobacterium ginsenosidimutans]|uniref:Lipocalin family protein n=1 Tax=Flavobacterium ginsenosidimutans TaxID=687844 RepID=A0ABZ2QDJ1_9FLAO|nr:lipocalin family protein [Flavobacterium ginsenosidimutans]KAF2338816.1 hypothetical protein DM444_00860 [Flavobacterium ginsenosidimutans]